MPSVTFIQPDGETKTVVASAGYSLMQVAQDNMVEGISGDCGGCCSCATCHCYVDSKWVEKVGPPAELEQDILEGLSDYRANSRLVCQIALEEELDGIVLEVAEESL